MNTHHSNSSWQEALSTALLIGVSAFMLFNHVEHAGAYSIDMAELSLSAWVGGVPHSPGYPLWTRLAEAALWVRTDSDPIHTLGQLSAVLATAAAMFTRNILRSFSVDPWASTGAALLLVVVPLCVRTFSIPEVYALDILLLSVAVWSSQKGSDATSGLWIALGWISAILAIGHRPVNAILMVTIAFGYRHIQRRPLPVLAGIASGIGLQSLLYADLWNRISDSNILWLDEHALAEPVAFLRFVIGLPFGNFLSLSSLDSIIHFSQLGIQCLGLLVAACLIPVVHRFSKLGWALAGMAGWHLVFVLLYQVGDRHYFLFPVLWTGILSLGMATLHLPDRFRPPLSATFCAGVLALAAVNHNGLAQPGHEQWRAPLRNILNEVPSNAVVISDDWSVRTSLVAVREMENIGRGVDVVRISLQGGDIQRLEEWLRGETTLVLLEERREIEEQRPIRVHDARLVPLLIERGLVTKPAEASTWAVIEGPTNLPE